MWQLFIGSLALSVIHALIPSHWLPIIAISKAENWKMRESLLATFLTAFAHLFSTIAIGVVVAYVGAHVFEKYEHASYVIAPVILLLIGLAYILIDILGKHEHTHELDVKNKRSKLAIITSLSLGMFFSPCLELEAYYLQAANFGVPGVITVSLVYLIVTLVLIMALVYLGIKGISHFKAQYLEKHAKRISGIVLIILGLIGFLGHVHH